MTVRAQCKMKMHKLLRISEWQQRSINPAQAFLPVQLLRLHIHEAGPVACRLRSVTCLSALRLFPRPGQYLRESTRRETRKAPLSGRLVYAVLSTRALNLRRSLRIAIGTGLSPTRCIGCCHQEPSSPHQQHRNRPQRDTTAQCPRRGRRMRVPQRAVYSVLPCFRTPSKTRR